MPTHRAASRGALRRGGGLSRPKHIDPEVAFSKPFSHVLPLYRSACEELWPVLAEDLFFHLLDRPGLRPETLPYPGAPVLCMNLFEANLTRELAVLVLHC